MSRLSWPAIALLCLTIGLAPYRPPHVVEKLALLLRGDLARAIDWFDFALHGAPWLLLAAKTGLSARNFMRSLASDKETQKRS
jgi:hypothetical protein